MIDDAMVSINGEITSGTEAKISIFDRGFLFGDSVYEVTHTYKYRPVKFDEHLDRLWRSAQGLNIEITYSKEDIIKLTSELIAHFKIPNVYLRIVLTRGEGEIGLDPKFATKNNLIIIIQALPENPSWWYDKGVEMIIADTIRTPIDSVDPKIKSGNYLNNVMAYAEAKKRGAFDAIMLNHQGHITEGTTNNIWLVKDGVVKTPSLNEGLLSGITRHAVLEICQNNHMDYKIESITPEEIKDADEAFLTSSTKHIVPVVKIDDQLIGNGKPGEYAKKILKLYRNSIEN